MRSALFWALYYTCPVWSVVLAVLSMPLVWIHQALPKWPEGHGITFLD